MIFGIDLGVFIFLVICLALVCAFEFINWFHDTANAVAPVIYTKSLKAKKAVLLAWFMNFLWVMLGWIWVAMAIIHLLPLDAIWYQGKAFWVIVIISLLLSAIIWNFATWYFGIPASSSHSLIWAILWVTITMQFIDIDSTIPYKKAIEVIESLLISPVVWFLLAFLIMTLSYKFITSKYYFSTPSKKRKRRPRTWLRSMLIAISAWVSFAHWSNDGQKWVWLAVLILVVLAPTVFAINPKVNFSEVEKNISYVENTVNAIDINSFEIGDKKTVEDTKKSLSKMKETLKSDNLDKFEFREEVLAFQKNIKSLKSIPALENNNSQVYAASVIWSKVDPKEGIVNNTSFNSNVDWISKVVDYAPWWIIAMISISLWLWTLVWRKRIVVTIWEKIGNTDMNYAQATTSALITAITISLASKLHLPVSTTHILSSSVAWTMSSWPKSEWVQWDTVKSILMAWVLTLPATIFLSALIFYVLWLIFI